MKTRVIRNLLIASIFVSTIPNAFAQVNTSGYQLTFQEEFTTKTIDSKKWNHLLPWGGVCNTANGELQAYKASNSTIKGGYLNITAKKEAYQGYSYTAGMLNTYNKFSQQYGILEIRYQLPSRIGNGKGYWPAFWLLPGSNGSFPWPPEIDALEASRSHPMEIAQTVHYQSSTGTKNSNTMVTAPYDTSTKPVTVTLEWEPTYMKWYVNGVLTKTVTDDAAIPKVPMYLLVNMAIGNKSWPWIGNPDASTKFPGTLKVDYIRVWKKG